MSDSRELAFAKELAVAAGKIMRQHFRSDSINIEFKNDLTPVTAADTEINAMVIDAIHKEFPGHSIVAEEVSDEVTSDYRWICDPVDGTLVYSLGIPISTFTLALAHKGEVKVGIVLDPFEDRLAWSERGKGSFVNKQRLHLPEKTDFKTIVGDIELWHGRRDHFMAEFNEDRHKPLGLCSTAYGAMMVAMGETHFSVFSGSKPWDTAGVSLIIEEAGGRTSDLLGNTVNYAGNLPGFIGAHPGVYDEILAMVQASKPGIAG